MTELEKTSDPNLETAPFTWKTLDAIAATEFVPKSLRGNKPAILAAILTGRELGLGPMESMRSIDIIDGQPSPSGQWMLSRVFEAGHVVYAETQTDRECTLVGVRYRDGDRLAEMSFTFTWEMAARAGLTGKSNWKKYPEAMLYWRAVSQLVRQFFPDVIHSVKYLPDELGDDQWVEEPPNRGTIEVNGVVLPYDASAAEIAAAHGADPETGEIIDVTPEPDDLAAPFVVDDVESDYV